MKLSIITLFIFICLFSNCYATGVSIIAMVINSTSIRYGFLPTSYYFSKWVFYKDDGITETGYSVHFDCNEIIDKNRWCTYHSPDNFRKFITTDYGQYCEVMPDGTDNGCQGESITPSVQINFIPQPLNYSFERPPTSGGIVYFSGYFLRFLGNLKKIGGGVGFIIPLIMDPFDPNFDATHFQVSFPAGSGTKSLVLNYLTGVYEPKLSYAAPIVTTFTYDKTNKLITLVGNNYATNLSKISVSINGAAIPQSNIALIVNHTKLQISNQVGTYGDYAGQVNVAITVDSVPMDGAFAYCYKPIPISVNSVSKRLGGTVTITGTYMPPPGSTNLIIMLGNDTCTLTSSTLNSIQCTLPPISNLDESIQLNALPLTVQIGDSTGGICKNDNGLTFTYGIPTLSTTTPVTQSGRLITITGTNLAVPSETSVIITGQGADIVVVPKSISSAETTLVFELPSLKCESVTLYVNSSRVSAKSSSITFKANFEAQIISSPLVNNGTGLVMKLLFVTCPLTTSIPSVIVGNNPSSTCSALVDGDFYSSKCTVPSGTGKDRPISISYNSKSFQSTYSYAAPVISSYSITDSNITIIGLNFGSSNLLFSAFYSNRTIDVIGTVTDSKFVFSRNASDKNNNITITVDNIVGNPYPIQLLPVAQEFMNTTNILSTSGDTIMVIGENFESSLSNNPEYGIKIFANSLVYAEYQVINDFIIIVNVPHLNSSTMELSFLVAGVRTINSTVYTFANATIENVTKINFDFDQIISFEIIGNNFRDDYKVTTPGINNNEIVYNCKLFYHNVTNNIPSDKLTCDSSLPVKELSSIKSRILLVNFGTDIQLNTTFELDIGGTNGVGSHLIPTITTVICMLFISISLLL